MIMNEPSDFIDNGAAAVTLRRLENNLITLGMGTMVFGLWNVAKSISIVFLNQSIFIDMLHKEMIDQDPALMPPDIFLFALFLFGVFLTLSVSLGTRLWIGFSAISVGKNRKKRTFYLPLSVLMILGSAYELYLEGVDLITNLTDEEAIRVQIGDSPLLSIFIELCSIIMIIELLVTAFRIRRIRKAEQLPESSKISRKDLHGISEDLIDHSIL